MIAAAECVLALVRSHRSLHSDRAGRMHSLYVLAPRIAVAGVRTKELWPWIIPITHTPR